MCNIYKIKLKNIQQCAGLIIKILFLIRLLKKILHAIKFLILIKYTIEKNISSLARKKIHSLYSLITNFRYVPYQKQDHVYLHIDERLKFGALPFETYYAIEEGYHSYATLRKANKQKDMLTSFSAIVKCIIPKDALYYINEDDEIVSSTIIVTDKIVN